MIRTAIVAATRHDTTLHTTQHTVDLGPRQLPLPAGGVLLLLRQYQVPLNALQQSGQPPADAVPGTTITTIILLIIKAITLEISAIVVVMIIIDIVIIIGVLSQLNSSVSLLKREH